MSIHISKFVDRIKASEARQQRDVVLTVAEARDLHADITKLLLALQESVQNPPATTNNEPINIEIGGGTF